MQPSLSRYCSTLTDIASKVDQTWDTVAVVVQVCVVTNTIAVSVDGSGGIERAAA